MSLDPLLKLVPEVLKRLCIKDQDGKQIALKDQCFTIPPSTKLDLSAFKASTNIKITQPGGPGSPICIASTDINVASAALVGQVLTITETDGSTHSVTLPPDINLVAVSEPDANGDVVFTRSDGNTIRTNFASLVSCSRIAACLGTQSNIAVAYNAGTGKIDFTVPLSPPDTNTFITSASVLSGAGTSAQVLRFSRNDGVNLDVSLDIPDSWRSVPGALKPDGTTDTTECIQHTGAVAIGNGLYVYNEPHELLALTSTVTTAATQTIQTKIAWGGGLHGVVRLTGSAQLNDDTIGLLIGLTDTPAGGSSWTSHGSLTPTQVRVANVGGFAAIEITWPVAYSYAYSVDLYGSDHSVSLLTQMCPWTIADGPLPGSAQTPAIIAGKPLTHVASSGGGGGIPASALCTWTNTNCPDTNGPCLFLASDGKYRVNMAESKSAIVRNYNQTNGPYTIPNTWDPNRVSNTVLDTVLQNPSACHTAKVSGVGIFYQMINHAQTISGLYVTVVGHMTSGALTGGGKILREDIFGQPSGGKNHSQAYADTIPPGGTITAKAWQSLMGGNGGNYAEYLENEVVYTIIATS